jgi:4-oxalocrotonate tautomerase
MPFINVKMTHEDGGATKEQKEKLAKGITELFADIFGRGASSAVVLIEEVSTDNYAIGGRTVSNLRENPQPINKTT